MGCGHSKTTAVVTLTQRNNAINHKPQSSTSPPPPSHSSPPPPSPTPTSSTQVNNDNNNDNKVSEKDVTTNNDDANPEPTSNHDSSENDDDITRQKDGVNDDVNADDVREDGEVVKGTDGDDEMKEEKEEEEAEVDNICKEDGGNCDGDSAVRTREEENYENAAAENSEPNTTQTDPSAQQDQVNTNDDNDDRNGNGESNENEATRQVEDTPQDETSAVNDDDKNEDGDNKNEDKDTEQVEDRQEDTTSADGDENVDNDKHDDEATDQFEETLQDDDDDNKGEDNNGNEDKETKQMEDDQPDKISPSHNADDKDENKGAKPEEDTQEGPSEVSPSDEATETETMNPSESVPEPIASSELEEGKEEESAEPVLPPSQSPSPPTSALPLSPSMRTKEQLIPDPNVFREVDDFVRKIGSTAGTSVEELCETLTSDYSLDIMKVRAFFCWTAFNIRYDTERYFSGNSQSQDAGSVLQSGQAVCEGFADLFESLCRLASIPCKVVHGIAKGFSHDPETVYTAESKNNHSWNLVRVDGEWRPLDCTWGAGHIDKDRQFNQKFKEHWFLTDPDVFVLRHFPLLDGNVKESEAYQLLNTPLTVEQFSASVRPESLAHVIGLTYVTHDHTVIDVTHDVTIQLKATHLPLGSVSVTLTERGSKEEIKDRCNALASLSDDGMCTIYVRPPRATTYLLDVMGQTKDQDLSKLHQLLVYVIRCKETLENPEPFPEKTGVWGLVNPTAALCGLKQISKDASATTSSVDESIAFNATDGEVKVALLLSRFTKLRAQLKHARTMDTDLAKMTFFEYTQDGATITTRLPKPGYYMLRLFASHPEKDGLHHSADLLLYTDKEVTCDPFPRAFQLAYRERVRLLQPLVGQVPSDEPTLYRVQAPSLGKLTVAGQPMDKKDDDVWEAEMTPAEGKNDVTIYAAVDEDTTSLTGLYQFAVSL